MIKPYIYSFLLLFLVMSCKNKNSNHSQHNMPGMEGMNMSTMKHDTSAIENYLYDVVNPVNEIVISNQKTIRPVVREVENNISADGYISFDERRNNKVSARFGGRIEDLYVKYNFQYVKKGEKIMELYSPEVNTIEEEYLHHLTTSGDKKLIHETKEKLLLLGLSESEIGKIEKTKKTSQTISVYSSYEGYVLFDMVEEKSSTEKTKPQNGMNMGIVSAQEKSPMQVPSTQIKEGSYVNEGQTLFMINDFKEVWAIVSFSPEVESIIKTNTPVVITIELADEQPEATINFIEPVYKEGQKFTQARIYLKNKKLQYKINSLLTALISEEKKLLSVPGSSILDLGKQKIVWIKTGNTKEGAELFRARKVVTGNDINSFTEIISGITEKDEIAKDAGFMIDSESLISVGP